MPRVSAIIVTHNYGEFLEESIKSVLKQDYMNLEVIVIDDGSTDNTEAIAKQFKQVKYIKKAHQGISYARNLGVSMAKGEYIAFLDADDIWCDNKLKSQVEFINKHPDTEIVFGTYKNFLEKEELIEDNKVKMIFNSYLGKSLITSLIKKSVFDKVGDFKEELAYGEDTDWFIRCQLSKIKMGYMDTLLAKRRLHGKNITIVSEKDEDDYQKIIFNILRERINKSKKSQVNGGENDA